MLFLRKESLIPHDGPVKEQYMVSAGHLTFYLYFNYNASIFHKLFFPVFLTLNFEYLKAIIWGDRTNIKYKSFFDSMRSH